MDANNNIKKILVAPLDWGLGHATRCIPIVRALVNAGHEVILAGEGAQAALLRKEFPGLLLLPLPGYKVRYSKHPSLLVFALLQQFPRLMKTLKLENRWLADVITRYSINLVISDNRYGLYSDTVPCIFITHQLLIKAPLRWLEKALQRINYKYINRFTVCWVPDAAGEPNAAGALSHPEKLPAVPVYYLGLLSRFEKVDAERKYDYCILLSGPEPQRTMLENMCLRDMKNIPGKILLVRGKPGSEERLPAPGNVEIKNHLNNNDLGQAIAQSDIVVSRSGYTTVMELLALHKKSILIPTPGQTEQEYLAKKLAGGNYCVTVPQSTFDCGTDLRGAKEFAYNYATIPVCTPAHILDLIAQVTGS